MSPIPFYPFSLHQVDTKPGMADILYKLGVKEADSIDFWSTFIERINCWLII